MNGIRRDELVREVFRMAANARSDEPSVAESHGVGHVVDDDELLIHWSLGDVTDEQHAQIIAHLADCPACRQELAAMIHAGALILPDAEEATDAAKEMRPVLQMTAAPARFLMRGRRLAGIVAALAACLLMGLFWVLSNRDDESLLALAQRDINEGNAARAFERMSQYLTENEGTASRSDLQEAKALLEESGYQVARRGIEDGNVKRVDGIVESASHKGAGSGRLANLRIQAQRGFAAENSLAVKGTLVDYGFELNGQSYEKSLPSMDAAGQRIDASFAAAVAAHPDTLQLRINYGQFLLEHQPSRALEQFLVAERIDPSNALAQTGVGLAMFQSSEEDAALQALPHFEKAAEWLPRDLDAHLNLAICLTRLGQREAARSHFETALTLCTDPALRQRIEKALDSR